MSIGKRRQVSETCEDTQTKRNQAAFGNITENRLADIEPIPKWHFLK